MSIHLICGDSCFSSSISYWNKIRESLAIATFDYMVSYRNDLYNEREAPDDSPPLTDAYNTSVKKRLFIKQLNECIHDIKFSLFQTNPRTLPTADSIHIALLKMYTYYLDLLTLLGIAGIFAITNKNDTEGYYSVGNSADIVHMMKIATRYIENDNILTCVNELVDFFQVSVRENMVVVITSNETPTPNLHNKRLLSLLYDTSIRDYNCIQRCKTRLSGKKSQIPKKLHL